MNGFKRSTLALLCLGAGFLSGCANYRDYVDPCWMSRYDSMVRVSVNETHDAQAMNGHVLDQTVWNKYFDVDSKADAKTGLLVYTATAKLNPAGTEHLNYILRRRPYPDGKLYLQTANDLPRDWSLEKIVEGRAKLDAERRAAVQNYVDAMMASRTDKVTFSVTVHDAPEPSIPALPISGSTRANPPGAIPSLQENFTGTIPANQVGTSH